MTEFEICTRNGIEFKRNEGQYRWRTQNCNGEPPFEWRGPFASQDEAVRNCIEYCGFES